MNSIIFWVLSVYITITGVMAMFLTIKFGQVMNKELNKEFGKNKWMARYLTKHPVRAKSERFIAKTFVLMVLCFLLFVYSFFTGMALRVQWWKN